MQTSKHYLSGTSTLLVLALLEKEDLYGYEIIKRLEEKSSNIFRYQAGTLYPALYRMEKEKLITKQESERRVYYSITNKGRIRLTEERKEWEEFSKGVQGVLEV